MKTVFCASCGHKMKKNGTTSAGRQRWRCPKCGASQTIRYDPTASRLDEFLGWLLSKDAQIDMPGLGRTFRRRTSAFWHIWPMPPQTGELHRVIYVDGIYLARNLVVLIASSKDYVLGWYMAESETARAWECLLAPIPAPLVVVSDGGSGFARAVRHVWPKTRVQRCVFHAFSQVRRYTTSRPRLQAGIELIRHAIDSGVNYTAGLPIIRTSPDHGTAYDIAGQGKADENSFRQAIYTAIDVFRNRQNYDEPLQNPLPKLFHEKRDDSEKVRFAIPKAKDLFKKEEKMPEEE